MSDGTFTYVPFISDGYLPYDEQRTKKAFYEIADNAGPDQPAQLQLRRLIRAFVVRLQN